MDALAGYPVYSETFDDLRIAADVGDQCLAVVICQRARALPEDQRVAAMLAVEHVAQHAPKRSIEHFVRELDALMPA